MPRVSFRISSDGHSGFFRLDDEKSTYTEVADTLRSLTTPSSAELRLVSVLGLFPPRPVRESGFPAIIEEASDEFNVPSCEILGPARHQSAVRARAASMLLCRHAFGWSFKQIGARFHRDPTSVMAAIERCEDYALEPSFRSKVDRMARCFGLTKGVFEDVTDA